MFLYALGHRHIIEGASNNNQSNDHAASILQLFTVRDRSQCIHRDDVLRCIGNRWDCATVRLTGMTQSTRVVAFQNRVNELQQLNQQEEDVWEACYEHIIALRIILVNLEHDVPEVRKEFLQSLVLDVLLYRVLLLVPPPWLEDLADVLRDERVLLDPGRTEASPRRDCLLNGACFVTRAAPQTWCR